MRPSADADEHRRGPGHRVTLEHDPGVGQGEQGHDDVARPRVEQLTDPFGDRHRTLDRRGGGADLFDRQLVAVLQGVDHGLGLEVGLQRHGRGQQAHHHPGDRRMDTGLVQAQPQPDPGGDEDRRIGDVQPAQHGDRGDDGGGGQQEAGREVVAVEDGDDDDGADVVDDRQREQEAP